VPYLYIIRNAQNKATMKLITTDKVPHAYETLRGSEGSWTVNASLSKDTAQWNWSLRVYYTDADGMRFEQGLWIGKGWTKAESRQELEQELVEQINKAPWLG
jgi:hypothetical protein